MGADIYLQSKSEKARLEYRPLFEQAVAERDSFDPGSDAEKNAQEKVSEYYEKMFSEGYFRDSYNTSSLFGVLGLSRWQLSNELRVDENGYLPIESAVTLKEKINAIDFDNVFSEWVAEHSKEGYGKIDFALQNNSEDSWKTMFLEKRSDLIALLDDSITLNEPLYWSV